MPSPYLNGPAADTIRRWLQKSRSSLEPVTRIFRDTGWAAIGQAGSAVGGIAETFLLARLLGVHSFGTIGVLTAIGEFTFGVLGFRSGEALIKFIPQLVATRGQAPVGALVRTILRVDLCVAILGFVILACAWPFLSLPENTTNCLLIIGSGIACRTVATSFGAFLRVTERFKVSIQIGLATVLVRLALICGALVLAPGVLGTSIAIGISDFAFLLIMGLGAASAYRAANISVFGGGEPLTKDEKRALYKFLFGTNLGSTLRIVSTKLDVILVKSLISVEAVGIYKIATRIGNSVLLISDPLYLSTYPKISKLLAANQSREFHRLVGGLTALLAAFTACLLIGFLLYGEYVISRLLGADYAQASAPATVALFGAIFGTVFFWLRPAFYSLGWMKEWITATSFGLGAQILTLLILAPRLGVMGAAIAQASSYTVTVLLALLIYYKRKLHCTASKNP